MKGILSDRFGGIVHALLLLAVLLVIGSPAFAQTATRVTNCSATTPNNAICLEWTHDGKAADGTASPPVTFRVEQKAGTGAYTTAATNLTTLKYFAQNLSPGDYLFRIFANCTSVPNVVTCSEGAASNVAGRNVAVPVVTPSAPVLIIAATIRADGPPTYRVVYTVRPREGEIVFVAPESMRPVFANR